jgi:hypothetical protein
MRLKWWLCGSGPVSFRNAGLGLDEEEQKCSKMLLVVPFPTAEQVKEAAAAGNVEAINELPLVLRREALWERFERTKLKSPEQLPDLQEEEIDLIWDTENAGGEHASVVI